MPVKMRAENGTWWDIKGFKFAVSFQVTGWGWGCGYAGQLHVGPGISDNPLPILINELTFERLVEEGRIVARPPS